jgi:hypothetical protein
MAGIIEEGKSVMDEFDDPALDAGLIASAQRVEHYEIAAYGTLVAWARAMGLEEAADLLQETLDEEKAADEKLTSLAEGGINQEAADALNAGEEGDDEEGDEEQEEEPAPPSRSRKAAGSKKKAAKGGRKR